MFYYKRKVFGCAKLVRDSLGVSPVWKEPNFIVAWACAVCLEGVILLLVPGFFS